MKYSDHNKHNQISIQDYLPEVYRSDINKALSDLAFDRQFTKDDTSFVSGFIGKGNPNAIVDRQIKEISLNSSNEAHRQAFQLAPTMYNKIGTEERVLTFSNFLKQLELQGVDVNRLSNWGSAIEFNWVPPINIDMLINYQNYFWDSTSSIDVPQYFTIENTCNKAEDKLSSYTKTLQQRGLRTPIISIDFDTNTFLVSGKWDTTITPNSTFITTLTNTENLRDKTWQVASVEFISSNNTTKITVTTPIANTNQVANPSLGAWWYNTDDSTLYAWDGSDWVEYIDRVIAEILLTALFSVKSVSFANNAFVVADKQDDLFTSGFVFITKNGTNINIQNKFWTTQSSSYDEDTNTTTITPVEMISYISPTPPTDTFEGMWWYNSSINVLYTLTGAEWVATSQSIIANISLNETINTYISELTCRCKGETGWDMSQWDDNKIGDAAWNTELLIKISHATELDWKTQNAYDDTMISQSNGNIQPFVLWYDTTTNQLKQYADPNTLSPSDPLYDPEWLVVANNFSAVLALTTSSSVWDASASCTIQPSNQWVDQNNWKHKTAVNTYSNVRRAQVPILEYDSTLELSEWTHVTRNWKYRNNTTKLFESTSSSPSRLELEPVTSYIAAVEDNGWTITLFDKRSSLSTNVDLTSVFTPNYKFRILDDNGTSELYTVEWSEFRSMQTASNVNVQGNYMATVVRIKEQQFINSLVGGVNNSRIIPIVTSMGEPWNGYHHHWVLDVNNYSTHPTATPVKNLFTSSSLAVDLTVEPVKDNVDYASFVPQVSLIEYTNVYQQLTIDIDGVTRIDLIDSLKYNENLSQPFALSNSDELRVYINNNRQYGNYTEITSAATIPYTAVNWTNTANIDISYVTGIEFVSSTVIKVGDIVRIEVGPAAAKDMGLNIVPVRTVESDANFSSLVALGTQPVYSDLSSYKLTEQHKTATNQYPLFNVYDLITNEVVKASPIFTFSEDSTQPINPYTSRRIVTSNNGTNFSFDQHLLGENSILYGYRAFQSLAVGMYWFNDNLNKLSMWNGATWTTEVIQNTSLGYVVRTPVISSSDPIAVWNISNAVWYNPTTNIIYTRDAVNGTWVELANALVSSVDPLFRTIWRHGTNNEQYVPSYVDKNLVPVDVGSDNGSWEVVEQWRFNPEHENRKTLTLSELSTHFRTILDNQPPSAGLIQGSAYSNIQSEYNYGVGGTIKEYNGSFDTLISAVNVDNITPIGVIEFAAQEYTSNLRHLRELFNDNIITLFNQHTSENLLDFSAYITNNIIQLYENNDFLTTIYHDTTAFNTTTNAGIRNWIGTAPLFGLAKLVQPYMLYDGTFYQVCHHDGHRTNVTYSLAEENVIAKHIISTDDIRAPGYKIGATGSTLPPANVADFNVVYGGNTVRTGVYWYQIDGTTRTFYRLTIYMISAAHPSVYSNGVEILDGTLYYNSTSNLVYRKQGLNWVIASPNGSYDISSAWSVIDFRELLGSVYLEVEQRLYDVCKNKSLVFDYSTLTSTAEDQLVYNNLLEKRFDEYVTNYSVALPYANIQYRAIDAFTWNYHTSLIIVPPHTDTAPANNAACWQSLYTEWFGTPYPHLEPWKLQGFTDKPVWWDEEYLETNGTRRWKFTYSPFGESMGIGMWENIRKGYVPTGRAYPSGVISTGNPVSDGQLLRTYNYFAVNISGDTITGGYTPDQLLPPYYATVDDNVRSLFTAMNQINAPDADYMFGDRSIIEWQWSISTQYVYDQPIIAFLMQPAKFLQAAFGSEHLMVDNLEVDKSQRLVYSHKNTKFHGDIYEENKIYQVSGLNQWYVNFNRYSGFDTNSDFRELWVKWQPLLTYSFNNIIDTSTLNVSNTRFEIIEQDYDVLLTNNGSVKDIWVDAFNVGIVSTPPMIVQYNNQNKWKLEISSLANASRTISYYDVKAYPFTVDVATNTCYAYRYPISTIDNITDRLYVVGNETDVFVADTIISITNSTSNDGFFTVVSSVYEPTTDTTRINVAENVNNSLEYGVISLINFVVPWTTGDMVVISSTKNLPAPLVHNTPYYIIDNGDNTFKLAETYNESLSNISIDVLSLGVGNHTIAEISGSFVVMGGTSYSKDTWYHYALDKTVVKTMTLPYVISGMQTLINIIDGYTEYAQDLGVIHNVADSNDFDPNTGRLITWSLEVERFIDWAYGLRQANMVTNDRYEFTVNTSDNTITSVDSIPYWSNGTAVQIASTGTLPDPIIANETYYIVQTDTLGTFKLSASQNTTYVPFHIDFTNTGSGHIYLSIKSKLTNFPQHEINPYRNNIWLDTPQGLLADITTSPYTDIRIGQTTFDQYGRALSSNDLIVFRQDQRNRISVIPKLQNDVDQYYTNDPYNYLHLGGGHFFLEGYEHVLLFHPKTVGGTLVYDSFLGLQSSKFDLTFFKKADYTLRPTLGGYYLKGNEFFRNIEGSATDLQNFYDTYAGSEDSPNIQLARSTLGYKNHANYMEMLNVNTKSQFVFYKGMLRAKGSVSSILAYINSRRFADAKIDEYWAVKLAEFGDNRVRVYPEILLFADDGIVDDIRFEFIGIEDDPTSEDIITAVEDKGFKLVSFSDETRWNNFPEQRAELIQPLFLDADISSISRVLISPAVPPDYLEIDYWFNTMDSTLRTKDSQSWLTIVRDKILIRGDKVLWKHSEPCDDVRIIQKLANIQPTKASIVAMNAATAETSAPNTIILAGDFTGYLFENSSIMVTGTTSNNGAYNVLLSSYDSILDITYLLVDSNIAENCANGELTYTRIDYTYTNNVPYTTEHYTVINSEVLEINQLSFSDILHIYTVRPSMSKTSPAKLVDRKSSMVISQIPLWHPAYGMHDYKATLNINLYKNSDPAIYSNPINSADFKDHFWNFTEVGTTWLDTSGLSYIPYYDAAIYPDINDRLYKWGNLAPFGEIKLYQWVESAVPPSSWDLLAMEQQGNISIPQKDKITGFARKTVFRRDREIQTGTITYGSPVVITPVNNIFVNDNVIFMSTDTILPNEFADNIQYSVMDVTKSTIPTFNLVNDVDGGALNVSPPTYSVSLSNIGTVEHPIVVFATSDLILSNSDVIKLSTIRNGLLPTGHTSIAQTSSDYQEVKFLSTLATTDSTGLTNDGTVYTATITVDNVAKSITITGSAAQTFATLLTQINTDLGASAVASIVNNRLRITSNGTTNPTIKIADTTLFKNIVGFEYINVISATTQYKVTHINTVDDGQQFELSTMDDTEITVVDFGSGELSIINTIKRVNIVPTFTSDSWVKQTQAKRHIIGAWLSKDPVVKPVFMWTEDDYVWYDGDIVDVYLNGVFQFTSTVVYNEGLQRFEVDSITGFIINPQDYIDIVRPIHTVTEEEAAFDPTLEDDGTTLVQWKEDYEYSQSIVSSATLENTYTTKYYFWVGSSTTKLSDKFSMSILEASIAFESTTDPYFIVQKPLNSLATGTGYGYDKNVFGDIWDIQQPIKDTFNDNPIMYREAIIRNIANSITNNNYMVQFNRDLTLRDRLISSDKDSKNLKNKHEEWLLFRKNQLNNIPEMLWDKVIEALTGESLIDQSPVPSLDRVLYDDEYGTTTRFGLGVGQAFLDRDMGIATVLNYLLDPTREFATISKTDFFKRHNFNTPAAVKEALIEIYQTFGAVYVNELWFELLQDALSTKPQFKEIFKTSWVALHGIRVLEVGGLFDD